MVTPQEIVERREVAGASLSVSPGSPSLDMIVRLPRTLRECRELAKRLAYSVVTGFIEHDRQHFEKCVQSFSQVFLHLFPEAGAVKIDRAASLYVEALFKHDEIENTPGSGPKEILEDNRWEEVRGILLGFSRTLGVEDAYADHTTDFWRFHGAGDIRYVNSLLESDRDLTSAILGGPYWSKILGSLYLACVDCHDKHDPTGLEAGLNFAARYFEIILSERMNRSEDATRFRKNKLEPIPIRVHIKL